MSDRTIVIREEIAALQLFNMLRAPLQKQLSKHAEQLLKVWTRLKIVSREEFASYATTFLWAELKEDGSTVKITFEWDLGDHTEGRETEEFPIEWFLDSQWVRDSEALIKSLEGQNA